MDMYFPRQYVKQSDLELFDGVSAGKYTIGLGQQCLSFVNDREDVYSIALSALSRLMGNFGISYDSIGRLEVATETIMDHSKSVKTVLMQLFRESGNHDVEGVDTLNACYAGTNALFNSIAWIESSAWDGRNAIVVVADIAEYAKGPARPTGGVGALAMLVGPNAPIALDPGMRASFMDHCYDFFKPHLSSPYPVVDGKLSQSSYLHALDICYQTLTKKRKKTLNVSTSLSSFDYVVFHAPYNKLVQKSYSRLLYNDFLANPEAPEFAKVAHLASVPIEQSYDHRELEQAFVSLSKAGYAQQVIPSTLIPVQLGNIYTASLFSGVLSLITTLGQALGGKKILMFAYGSGCASSIYSFTVGTDEASLSRLSDMQQHSDISSRLADRLATEPSLFDQIMIRRESLHHREEAHEPQDSIDTLAPGSYYLTSKDREGRRSYSIIPS